MIKIIRENDFLLLEYYPQNGVQWVYDIFLKGKSITLRKTYTFKKEDLYNQDDFDNFDIDEDRIVFKIGILNGDYYKLNSEVLSLDVDLYIKSNIDINDRMFTAYRNISIFRKINEIVNEDIHIGDDSDKLPLSVFERLISLFPNTSELNKYASARIGSILRDYFDSTIDAHYIYENYMNKKYKNVKKENLINLFSHQEFEKYNYLLEQLKYMLKNEINYTEKQWQKMILQIIQLIYPKYIKVFEEVEIKDVYNNKNKRLDYLLVDSNGNIDIIEIKKPFGQSIVSQNKYRDNYIPLRELSGSVMQVEKYIFYLNKWGRQGEETLTKRYQTQLPDNFHIKIVNPSGIIIMGREHTLTQIQSEDFEVIKRKFKNVIDIITYDELVSRLEHIIYKFNTQ
ncbi:Shedu immune nuclease family protein [Paenibacillus sp. MSJ-34]|uniref:Shedu immune nuclease family protein n=1 Tax=Paenibacillus sp. MSJ-34 TaxID=2841529 RepID=UPI001C118B50|nr:Shedu immune nuclease family protein [Paenibacillus sp. MSJ-34]MBU5445577.1 DUF4263 domain-containing protein [Paenibacillus sp. MSJ-34]